MGVVIGILLVFSLVAFTAYEIITIIQFYRQKKKGKIEKKEENK